MRRHQPTRLVIEEEPRALARRKRFAIDCNAIRGGHIKRWRGNHRPIDRDAAGGDPRLGLAARGKAGAGDHLGDSLARFALLVHFTFDIRHRIYAHRLAAEFPNRLCRDAPVETPLIPEGVERRNDLASKRPGIETTWHNEAMTSFMEMA